MFFSVYVLFLLTSGSLIMKYDGLFNFMYFNFIFSSIYVYLVHWFLIFAIAAILLSAVAL